ncbi:MFS transporter [Nonomuraea sp. NPDC050536]|uniref:MFS transporter n=1 Tax=Nonomuraea sp. NPDC050536 TaxID=3364366 RepID=UPI0037C69151
MKRTLFSVMAVCAGATVANVYLAQPLLELIATGLGVPRSAAGIVVTCAQFGYAAGILFLVPLGDVRRRRPLLTAMLSVTVVVLLVAAAAPGLAVLGSAAAAIGVATVVPQVLIPLASELAPPDQRGRVVARVQIGLMTGIVASRVVGGGVGELLGWRAVYVLAAVLTLVTGALTLRLLPAEPAKRGMGYGRLLGSLPGLLRDEPALRHSSLLQAGIFGGYTATWTTLVLVLTAAPYHFGNAVAGLFGLLGLGGSAVAPFAGRYVDRIGPTRVIVGSLVLVVASAGLYALGGHALAAMIAGIVLANVAIQAGQIANLARVFAYLPDARSRANTVFMVTVFLTGALSAALASAAYGLYGWAGACGVQAALGLVSFLVVPFMRRYDRAQTSLE